MRIPSAEELQSHFHDFFTGELGAGEVVKDKLAMFLKELDALSDAFTVAVFELKPPVWLKFG